MKRIHFSIDNDEANRIKQSAQTQEVSVSAYIRSVLREQWNQKA